MTIMTSNEFEKTAKNELIRILAEEYKETFTTNDIIMLWFGYVLGNMKGMFIDSGVNNRYYEVTYGEPSKEMYIDIYHKRLIVRLTIIEE